MSKKYYQTYPDRPFKIKVDERFNIIRVFDDGVCYVDNDQCEDYVEDAVSYSDFVLAYNSFQDVADVYDDVRNLDIVSKGVFGSYIKYPPNMSGLYLKGADLSEVKTRDFRNANLENAVLPANIKYMDFRGANLDNVDMGGRSLYGVKINVRHLERIGNLDGVDFYGCTLCCNDGGAIDSLDFDTDKIIRQSMKNRGFEVTGVKNKKEPWILRDESLPVVFSLAAFVSVGGLLKSAIDLGIEKREAKEAEVVVKRASDIAGDEQVFEGAIKEGTIKDDAVKYDNALDL